MNPHDIKNPLLLVFLGNQGIQVERISLDWDDTQMAAYYERVKKGNRHVLHEFATKYPAAAARCVHWTFDQMLQVLFNCAPAANVNAEAMHTDGIAARCEPGLANYLSSYLGIVEPQMRKTEHVHALLQVLGFRNPRQYFLSGDFVHLFRQVWSYVASVSFTSQEACAENLHPAGGLQVLCDEPLLPVMPGQLSKIGHDVERQYLQCQRDARGMNEEPVSDIASQKTLHSSWTPHAYGDVSLSAEEWGCHAVRDCNRGAILNANHVCRPNTCYKGKWAKRRFCRMFYWRWARVLNKKKQEVTRRMHGCLLSPRWNGVGLPPVIEAPPNRGAPALERNHGFHGKVVPGVMLGPRCNHDMRKLLHLPVLSDELAASVVKRAASIESNVLECDQAPRDTLPLGSSSSYVTSSHASDNVHNSELDEAIDEGIETKVDELVTRMYYAAGYAGKEQPHAANLLHTLHDSLVRFDHFSAERQIQGLSTEPVARARRLLQSLVAATNRRMHIGFPTVYAFLLGKPNHYCSNQFASCSMHQFIQTITTVATKILDDS